MKAALVIDRKQAQETIKLLQRGLDQNYPSLLIILADEPVHEDHDPMMEYIFIDSLVIGGRLETREEMRKTFKRKKPLQ